MEFVAFMALAVGWTALGVTLLMATAADLVRQPVEVPFWWFVPIFINFVGGECFAVAAMVFASDLVPLSALLQALILLTTAITAALVGLGLCVARGLRPGGDVRRPLSWAVLAVPVAFLTFCGLAALLMFAGPYESLPSDIFETFDPEAVGATLASGVWWMVFAPLGGIAILALERRGEARVENARHSWYGLLAGTAVLFWMAVFQGFSAGRLIGGGEPNGPGFWGGVWVVLMVVSTFLPFGLARTLGRFSLVAPCLSMGSLWTFAAPTLAYALWWPQNDPVPEFVDLRGHHRTAPHLGLFDCLQGSPGCGANILSAPVQIAPPTAPLDTRFHGMPFAVDRGRGRVPSPLASKSHGCATVSRAADEVHLEWTGEVMAWGPPLQDHLEAAPGVLCVAADPAWTLQDFVTLCASAGRNRHCRIVGAP